VDQRVSLITLGVDDVGRARRFYEALGWRGQEVEETAFFQAGGLAIVLWGRAKLAEDAGVEVAGAPRPPDQLALALNVRSRDEVDAAMDEAARAGATITRPAAETLLINDINT
jgi:hypothetical protein